MNKQAFRPRPPVEEPEYPTHEQVDRHRRDFLKQCGTALAGLSSLALVADLIGSDLAEPQGDKDKKKNGKKKNDKKKRPPQPVPGGPRHPRAPIDPAPKVPRKVK